MQCGQHTVLFGVRRCQRLFRAHFFLNDALLDEVLVNGVAQRNYPTGQPMRVILGLQLHFLLGLVHLDRLQAVFI